MKKKVARVRKTVTVLCLLTVVLSCDDPAGPGTELAGDWSGTWTENFPDSTYNAELSLNLLASDHYRGPLETDEPRSAFVVATGLTEPNKWKLEISFTDPCSGDVVAVAALSAGTLTGSFSGSDCVGHASGTFELSR